MSLFIGLRYASQFDKMPKCHGMYSIGKEIPEQLIYVTRLLRLPLRIYSVVPKMIS